MLHKNYYYLSLHLMSIMIDILRIKIKDANVANSWRQVPILVHTRAVPSELASFLGQKLGNGCQFVPENLQVGCIFWRQKHINGSLFQ